MDPEYELAIKISEYFEFLWDGRIPVWSHGHAAVTFADLIPSNLDSAQSQAEGDSFRAAVLGERHDAVAEEIYAFLLPPESRKPRLRRAAKTAGLWMPAKRAPGEPKRDMREEQHAERYVARLDEQRERFLPSERRFRIVAATTSKEQQVLDQIAAQSSTAIAADLIALARFCARHSLAKRFPNSVASLQYDLSNHFFCFPAHMSELAEALRYVPSFTARVTDALLTAAPGESVKWFSRVHHEVAYGLAASFGRQPMAVKIAAALRKGPTTAAGMVETAIAEINPELLSWLERPARIEQLDSGEKDRAFAIGMYLLAAKPWCVKIADAFAIPVPFGVLLGEELEHIEQCRLRRRVVATGISPEHGVVGPHA